MYNYVVRKAHSGEIAFYCNHRHVTFMEAVECAVQRSPTSLRDNPARFNRVEWGPLETLPTNKEEMKYNFS